jgi:PAB-dependent poly(A)-specific ribonuclease subunit 2
MSPTGAYMAFGDAEGVIHLMSAAATADDDGSFPLNGFDGQPIEWADTPKCLPDIQWTDKV